MNLDEIKQILLDEKIIYFSKKDSTKLIFNPNIYRILNIKEWVEGMHLLSEKYPGIENYLKLFPESRQLVDALNRNLLEPPKCPYCDNYRKFIERRGDHYLDTCGNSECIAQAKNITRQINHPTEKIQIKKEKHPKQSKKIEEISGFNTIKEISLKEISEVLKCTELDVFEKLKVVFNKTGLAIYEKDTGLIKPISLASFSKIWFCKEFNIQSKEDFLNTLIDKFEIIKNFINNFPEGHKNIHEIFYCINNKMILPKKCDFCENYCNFIGNSINGYYPDTCCHKCGAKKAIVSYKNKTGYEFALQDPAVREKIKETNLKNHGGVWNNQTQEDKEKRKITYQERYGVNNPMKVKEFAEKQKESTKKSIGYEYATQNPEFWKRVEEQYMKNYGVRHQWAKGSPGREKGRNTCKEKFGFSEPLASPKIREKIKETNLKKYGYENCGSSPNIINKRIQTNIKKYGYRSPSQSPELTKNYNRKYNYKNISFDSSWELAYYIWCEDHNIKIERCYDSFTYYDSNKNSHEYFPDFKLNNIFIEIKGNHLIDENGNLRNPYKSKQAQQNKDFRYHKTLLMKNLIKKKKLKILSFDFISFILNWVKNKYGKDYLKSFSTKNQKEN